MHRDKIKKDQQLLHRLLQTIRSHSEQEAQPLLSLIRNDASTTEIEAHIDQLSSQERRASESAESELDSTFQSGSSTSEELFRHHSPDSIQTASKHSPLKQPTTSNHHTMRENPTSDTYPWPGFVGRANQPLYETQVERDEAMNDRSFSSTTKAEESGNDHSVSAPRTTTVETVKNRGSALYVDPSAIKSFGNLPLSSAIKANGYPPSVQRRQLDILRKPDYLCTPLIIESGIGEDALSKATLGFRDQARSLIANGDTVEKVLSMKGIDTELFFRDRTDSDPHTVSTWACEFTKTFDFLPVVPRLATLQLVGSFMRWMILPCRETWLAMPEMIRPLTVQLLVPHQSLYIDVTHVPQMRFSQLMYGRRIERVLKPDTVRCDWAFGEQACVEQPVAGGAPRWLSSAFLRHIDDTKNWSLHRHVLEEFPELETHISLHDD